MKLSDYDLRQIDKERINHLSETAVKNLSFTLRNDLKEARERLNQNSKNVTIQSSSLKKRG
jgi:transposase